MALDEANAAAKLMPEPAPPPPPPGLIAPPVPGAGKSVQPRSALVQHLRDAARRFFVLAVAAAAVTIAVALGVLSARYMIRHGTGIATDAYGPWVHWRAYGREAADPYTRAHVAQTGALRLAADAAGVYEADSDEQGAYLHSSCDYIIEGPYPNGLWWSIAVFDSRGALIANEAERYAFTVDTIAPNPDGSYIVTLGRDARPGNWLPTGGAGRLVVVFTLLDPATGFSEEERAERYKLLPEIRRENCS